MSHLLELYREKKHFLEEFTNLNSNELQNFANGHFDNIETFYNKREKILQIIQLIDDKINLQGNQTGNRIESLNQLERRMLESATIEIRSLTQAIIKQDMDILSLIEATKSAIINELRSLGKNKKSVSNYKTKVDHHQIDEEA